MTAALTSTTTSKGTLRCFIVEDSPVICSNLVDTLDELVDLQLMGTAEEESQAIEWLNGNVDPCDLMIIDIFLKSGTGLEVLKRARSALPNAALVVLTNYATADMRKRCLLSGADRVFDKSAELDELLDYCSEVASRH